MYLKERFQVVNLRIKVRINNYFTFFIIFNYRTKRLFTYRYILQKRVKELRKEMLKRENLLVPMIIILKKVISFERLEIPRLKVFEEICPSSNE